tara:strand:+ start:1544 stop:2554 length:1011 start_codon:yes stop_codon:yes gene_type:complete
MKFLDQAKIYIQSGKGGMGCVSFRREKFVEYGGPDGGNGGKGGDVSFIGVKDLNTLIDFRYQQHYKAGNGEHGKGANRTGANGSPLQIKVPVGTQILAEDQETLLADITEEGQVVELLRGGDGGKGNAHYKSSTNQAPRKNTPGFPGQEMAVWLRLKLIADAGLLGLPNAGKSTFLAAVSAAKPKIADYPFTTLAPNLGVIKLDEGASFVLADIPGLIEGASEGHGLGDRFLGHVERTSVLLHLVDMTQDDPVAAYHTIRQELKSYDPRMMDKQEIVALNKADALGEELAEDVRKNFETQTGLKTFVISAVAQTNIKPVIAELFKTIQQEKAQAEE